jgi:hypothetical protein
MSIKLEFSKGSMKTAVLLKDLAFGELMMLINKYQTDALPHEMPPMPTVAETRTHAPTPDVKQVTHTAGDQVGTVKHWLASHTASEVLNRIKWETYPEKILLMGAFHESTDGAEGWKSADMEKRFDQAKETFPANFPREIRLAVDSGTVGAVTPRTYKVGRAGWNKIADAVAKLV